MVDCKTTAQYLLLPHWFDFEFFSNYIRSILQLYQSKLFTSSFPLAHVYRCRIMRISWVLSFPLSREKKNKRTKEFEKVNVRNCCENYYSIILWAECAKYKTRGAWALIGAWRGFLHCKEKSIWLGALRSAFFVKQIVCKNFVLSVENLMQSMGTNAAICALLRQVINSR